MEAAGTIWREANLISSNDWPPRFAFRLIPLTFQFDFASRSGAPIDVLELLIENSPRGERIPEAPEAFGDPKAPESTLREHSL